jgi:phenylalanyl-tRNA synthetase alpha subunit
MSEETMTPEEIEQLKKELTAARSAATKATNKLKELDGSAEAEKAKEIDALKRQLELEKKKSEAAAVKAEEAEKKLTSVIEANEYEEPFDEDAWLKQRVPYVVPLISEQEPDKFVSVNGFRMTIQRGEQVMIPRYVANTLEEERLQQLKIMKMKMALKGKN